MTTIVAKSDAGLQARRWWPEAVILLTAAVIRFWRLDYHSFWFDETVSLDWAEDGPAYIWQSTFTLLKDKHPPGYYLLLHSWQKLLEPLGLAHDDVALRALGALLGVLTVLGMLLLVRRLSGRPTARLAGSLIALSPVLVWYSQELRMFQPATTALVWGAYCLLRGWQGERPIARLGWWLGMIAALSFALYSYLFSAFVLPAAGLTLAGLWLGERRSTRPSAEPSAPLAPSATRRFLEGALALAITGLIFLPLARSAWLVNDSEGTPGRAFMDFFATLQRQVQIFTVWRAPWAAEVTLAAVLFFALLALIGLFAPWPRRAARPAAGAVAATRTPVRPWTDQLWLLLWIGAPLLIGNLLLATSDTVFKEDRYFLFLAPFVLWATARGVLIAGRGRALCGGRWLRSPCCCWRLRCPCSGLSRCCAKIGARRRR